MTKSSISTDPAAEWHRKVAAFKASRHTEAREARRLVNAEDGWSEPLPRPGERVALGIYGSHWLMEVLDPPGWGFRLVSLVVNGQSLTWDLPGYDRREAEKIATLLIDDYIWTAGLTDRP
jgi:hypothetical protein